MNEPKTLAELYYWLEVELSIMHILIYVLMGIMLGGYWWILLGIFSVFNFIFMTKKAIKLVKSQNLL